MCVESVTADSPQAAKTLNRPGSTCMRSAWPPVRSASFARWPWRKAPTSPSFSVIDSISTRARVSSKTFIGIARCCSQIFVNERNEKRRKDTREARLVSSLLDSAPSVSQRMTVDRPFSLSPNRPDGSHGDDFGGEPLSHGPPKAARNRGPATDGLRTSTKNIFSL